MTTLSELSTIDGVASYASSTPDTLQLFIKSKEIVFTRFEMKKRGGKGTRTVYRVHESVKSIHRRIALWVAASWAAPDCVHGFRKGRSIVSHAKVHLGQEAVVTADVMDFFPSISADRVREAFLFLGASGPVADLLTELSTIDGLLPAGTRCSPIIANVVCRDLDADFSGRFERYGRYADDLALSGPPQTLPTETEVADILQRHGFTLRAGSYFCVGRNRTQYITGLIVNHPHGPHVGGALKRALRQEVHLINTYGIESHCSRIGSTPLERLLYLKGKLNQIRMAEPGFADPLLADLPDVESTSDPEPFVEFDEDFWS
jgi:hypothetical protein